MGRTHLAGRGNAESRSSSTACRSDQTLLSASQGATFGLFPIMWIVVAAIWVYNMTVETGHFAVLRRSFGAISDDQRVQAVIVAFCFGALLEALAGFGTPVAITAVMLIALGFKPIKAAAVALVANTAPVAFGAIATPIITLTEVTELPKDDLGAMVGRQTPVLALIVPLILVFMVDGRRGVRQVWPVAVLGGMAFAVGQFLCCELLLGRAHGHRRGAARDGVDRRLPARVVAIRAAARRRRRAASRGRRWPAARPRPRRSSARSCGATTPQRDSTADVIRAYAPYVIVIAVFSIAQIPAVKDALAESPWTTTFQWPGLDVVNPDGERSRASRSTSTGCPPRAR